MIPDTAWSYLKMGECPVCQDASARLYHIYKWFELLKLRESPVLCKSCIAKYDPPKEVFR